MTTTYHQSVLSLTMVVIKRLSLRDLVSLYNFALRRK
nr:MAG TPA: hypothetical protein [Caudoviricetes sp.]